MLNDAAHLLAYEFARARRYERPISVVAIAPTDLPDQSDVRLRFCDLRDTLFDTLLLTAECDLLCTDPRTGAALIVLPESNATSLAGTVQRIRGALAPDVRLGAASFPDDALTLEETVSLATARLQGTAAPSEVA